MSENAHTVSVDPLLIEIHKKRKKGRIKKKCSGIWNRLYFIIPVNISCSKKLFSDLKLAVFYHTDTSVSVYQQSESFKTFFQNYLMPTHHP